MLVRIFTSLIVMGIGAALFSGGDWVIKVRSSDYGVLVGAGLLILGVFNILVR